MPADVSGRKKLYAKRYKVFPLADFEGIWICDKT
jgi:hypothetical protein